jgi:hypothetical protein
MRLPWVLLLSLVVSTVQAQGLGRLMYRTSAGRAVTLQIVDGGHPAFIGLKKEQGDAEVLRQFVLAHSGPEKGVDPRLAALRELAPPHWKVDAKGDRTLLKGAEATFWRYTPGLVLPVRFKLLKQDWALMAAELPHRMFVESGG